MSLSRTAQAVASSSPSISSTRTLPCVAASIMTSIMLLPFTRRSFHSNWTRLEKTPAQVTSLAAARVCSPSLLVIRISLRIMVREASARSGAVDMYRSQGPIAALFRVTRVAAAPLFFLAAPCRHGEYLAIALPRINVNNPRRLVSEHFAMVRFAALIVSLRADSRLPVAVLRQVKGSEIRYEV